MSTTANFQSRELPLVFCDGRNPDVGDLFDGQAEVIEEEQRSELWRASDFYSAMVRGEHVASAARGELTVVASQPRPPERYDRNETGIIIKIKR